MKPILLIMLGGGIGALSRYWISSTVLQQTGQSFLGTMAANVVGCLLAGVVLALVEKSVIVNPEVKLLITVGFLGALTTFSTYQADSLLLLKQGHMTQLLINMLGSVTIGFIVLWVSYASCMHLLKE